MPGPIDTDMLAASARVLDAETDPVYGPLAVRAREGRASVADRGTDAAVAARAVADAILDDDAPLRVACDPLGAGMLQAWRAADNEAWQRDFREALCAPRRPPRS
jgi:hypothetical protein